MMNAIAIEINYWYSFEYTVKVIVAKGGDVE